MKRNLVGTGTSVRSPRIAASCSRMKAEKGFSKKSTSPTRMLEASAPFGIFFIKWLLTLKGRNITLRSSCGSIRGLTFVGASELSATVSFEVFLGISSPEPMKRNNQKISQTRRFVLDKIFTIYKYIFSCLLFERFKPLNVKACNHNHESKRDHAMIMIG